MAPTALKTEEKGPEIRVLFPLVFFIYMDACAPSPGKTSESVGKCNKEKL